jgi:hypothetical protein
VCVCVCERESVCVCVCVRARARAYPVVWGVSLDSIETDKKKCVPNQT